MAIFLATLPVLFVLPLFAYAQLATVTSYGPGQFCQGYSPGGGDSCMTIPAGCYVVPSGYNVVPELHCSTTTSASSASSATPSSTFVTTTRLASSTATSVTSSYGPSTSAQSTNQASSTPTFSSPTSSVLSSITTPLTTSTDPISTTPTASASSTAGGAVVIAGLVGAASDALSKANDAAKTFGSDPSSDNKQALQDAVSSARSQTSKAKDAADATNLTDLSSKLDETLAQLTEAATELAKAEALADMAVAVAPEVAAALAAATAAKEIADENDPSKPTRKPTNSAQSASATITSGSPSSSVTSSATLSSSSGCPACVECADSTIAPGPSPAPEDPFPQWTLTGGEDDGEGGNGSTRKTRRRTSQSLERRATTSDRDIEICQTTVQVPPYNSWNGAGVGNSYSSYYSYKYSNAKPGSCVKYDFDTVVSSTRPDTKDYATEHVYEIQLINIFLNWMKDNNAELQAFLATKNNKQPPPKNPANICNSLFNQLLFGQGSVWTTTKFGNNGAIGTVGSRPIDELVSQLSGNARSTEMVYLEDGLNGMKAQLFGNKSPSAFTKLVDKLAILARSAMVYGYLEQGEISTIFKAVSTRMKAFYAKLDTACAGKTTGPCGAKIQWADSYQTWQAQYLDQIDANWKTWKNGQLDGAKAQLRSSYPGQAWAKTLLANVEANLDLQDAYYHIAGDLKI